MQIFSLKLIYVYIQSLKRINGVWQFLIETIWHCPKHNSIWPDWIVEITMSQASKLTWLSIQIIIVRTSKLSTTQLMDVDLSSKPYTFWSSSFFPIIFLYKSNFHKMFILLIISLGDQSLFKAILEYLYVYTLFMLQGKAAKHKYCSFLC